MKKFLIIAPVLAIAGFALGAYYFSTVPGQQSHSNPTELQMNCRFWDVHATVDRNKAVLRITQNENFDLENEFLARKARVLGRFMNVKDARVVLYREPELEFDSTREPRTTRLAFIGRERRSGQEVLFQGWFDPATNTMDLFTIEFLERIGIRCEQPQLVPFRL
ncbi:MAG: hypothetical protein FWE64_03460 [Alphaproteobacteria bacterium]|nr:hypothetical protein [Alphaproteobacteria bacterium]